MKGCKLTWGQYRRNQLIVPIRTMTEDETQVRSNSNTHRDNIKAKETYWL